MSLAPQPGGYTLDKLAGLARDKGLDLVAVHRAADQPVPVPAIVHWRSGHYAALITAEGDRYEIRDPALERDYWVSRDTLDEEGSGYYLAPRAQLASAGWKLADAETAARVIGAGYTGGFNNTATQACTNACGCDGASQPRTPMMQAAAQSMLVSLALSDTPIVYAPARGPSVPLTLTYSQREAYQPATFHYFNFGPNWTYAGLSYIVDDPAGGGSGVQRYEAAGGTTKYTGYNATSGEFVRDPKDLSMLVRVSASPIMYERRLSDGSKEVYAEPDAKTAYPRRIFLSQIVDPAGNALSFAYDGQLRLTTITDADGRDTTLQYDHADPLLVTGITDPFGRQAVIAYDSQGRLESITDVIGITSTVTYAGSSGFVDSLTTPYGTSHFTYGESGVKRWLELTDPKGETERVEFLNGASGIPFSESQVPAGINAFNSYINGRNSFYWDKTAHARANGNYAQARIKHWYHDITSTSQAVAVLESIKNPLESRIWYNYPGQSWAGANGTCDKPSTIGRVLPDGNTQLTRMEYNPQDNITRRIDPKGRETLYVYEANGIDLAQVKQKTASGYDVIAAFT
jgi:YD repeat-containing protein